MIRYQHTNLDVTTSVEQDVITLDVSMDDVLVVEMLQTLASLSRRQSNSFNYRASAYL